MTLLRPLFLLALLALPVLWWLSRVVRHRRVVHVPDLFLWSRLDLPVDPPRETRRRADRLLLLRLAAAALVAFGLAGPRLSPAGPSPELHVLLDDSPSMGAFRAEADAALAAVRGAAPKGARVVVHRVSDLSELPGVLATAGRGDVAVITDHRPAGLASGGRIRLALVGRPVENAGIVSAAVREGRFTAVVRNFGAHPRHLAVRSPAGTREITLPPGESELLAGPAPEGRAAIRIEPGDAFSFDDRVVVATRPATTVALGWTGPDEPRTRLALALAGVRFTGGAGANLAYRRAPDPETRLVVAPPGPRRPVDAGSLAGAGGLPPEAVPPPGISLGGAVRLRPAREPLLVDGEGVLAAVRGDRIEVALDPGDPASGWPATPSFPIFWAEIAARLGARPATSVILSGTVDPRESATRPVSAGADLSRLVPSAPRGKGRGTDLAALPFLLAAAALAVHLVLERRPVI